MSNDEKKRWSLIAITGTIFLGACLIVSILQYISHKSSSSSILDQYCGLIINITGFAGFLCLLFNPSLFIIYFFIFYVYGLGNLIDNGNILGALCILVSVMFLWRIGALKKRKILKLSLLMILPVAALIRQIFSAGYISFLISFMHILGMLFIVRLMFMIFYQRTKSIMEHHTQVELSSEVCSKQELEWLTDVAKGEKYINICNKYNISESFLKKRLLELYKLLGVQNKTEFLTKYHECNFLPKE